MITKPNKPNKPKKTRQFTMLMSENEINKLRQQARINNISMGKYIRQLIFFDVTKD